jgi:hypothetical protein
MLDFAKNNLKRFSLQILKKIRNSDFFPEMLKNNLQILVLFRNTTK